MTGLSITFLEWIRKYLRIIKERKDYYEEKTLYFTGAIISCLICIGGVIPATELKAASYNVIQTISHEGTPITYSYDVHISTSELKTGTVIMFDVPDEYYNQKEKDLDLYFKRQETFLQIMADSGESDSDDYKSLKKFLQDKPNAKAKRYLEAGWAISGKDSVVSSVVSEIDESLWCHDQLECFEKGKPSVGSGGHINFDGKTVRITIKDDRFKKYEGYKDCSVEYNISFSTLYEFDEKYQSRMALGSHSSFNFKIDPFDGEVFILGVGDINKIQANVDFSYDANAAAKNAAKAVYEKGYAVRLYNEATGDHIYTPDINSALKFIDQGWIHETKANGSNSFKGSTTKTDKYTKPVYCAYNPNNGGFHLYSNKKGEVSNLENMGWKLENGGKPVFYTSGDKNKKGIYRAYNPNSPSGQQHYCIWSEYKSLLSQGWQSNNNDKPYWYTD